MRIIIILLTIILLYFIVKSLTKKDDKLHNKLKQEVLYCKYCKTYMTTEEICSPDDNNYKNCKNYKN
jgi:uncharacterized membrane protein